MSTGRRAQVHRGQFALGSQSRKSEESSAPTVAGMQAESSSTVSATLAGFLVGLAVCLHSSPVQAGLLAQMGGGIVYEQYDTPVLKAGDMSKKMDQKKVQKDKQEAQKRRLEEAAKDKAKNNK